MRRPAKGRFAPKRVPKLELPREGMKRRWRSGRPTLPIKRGICPLVDQSLSLFLR